MGVERKKGNRTRGNGREGRINVFIVAIDLK